jgi:hypothetical protein
MYRSCPVERAFPDDKQHFAKGCSAQGKGYVDVNTDVIGVAVHHRFFSCIVGEREWFIHRVTLQDNQRHCEGWAATAAFASDTISSPTACLKNVMCLERNFTEILFAFAAHFPEVFFPQAKLATCGICKFIVCETSLAQTSTVVKTFLGLCCRPFHESVTVCHG